VDWREEGPKEGGEKIIGEMRTEDRRGDKRTRGKEGGVEEVREKRTREKKRGSERGGRRENKG
jgi:hypothetical protein